MSKAPKHAISITKRHAFGNAVLSRNAAHESANRLQQITGRCHLRLPGLLEECHRPFGVQGADDLGGPSDRPAMPQRNRRAGLASVQQNTALATTPNAKTGVAAQVAKAQGFQV